jgi:hypothetical protein
MSNFIALSKNLEDNFITSFANGSGGEVVDQHTFVYEDSTRPIAFRGINKRQTIKRCWEDNRDFYFMDTGYFANYTSKVNPKGVKRWHRIVKNNVQHLGPIIDRPTDRWDHLQKEFPKLRWTGWKKDGRKILVVLPSEKPCKFYGINLDKWIEDTMEEIQKYTSRPIEIRRKPEFRLERVHNFTIYDNLDRDIFALVTYNSIAAIEAIAYGIPAFTLAPNAAGSLALSDLSKLETPYYPDPELVHRWCCHLAYGQFHNNELANGEAWKILTS